MKLFEVLKGQDISPKSMEKVAQQAYPAAHSITLTPADPITSIIVEAWKSAGGPDFEFDSDTFVNDLQYAIDQLKKVQLTIRP